MRFKYRHIIVMATLIKVLALLVSAAAAKTLRVSCDWNENEPVYRWLEFAAKEFEKLNPGVQVVIQSEHRTFGQTVKQRILAGDIPDVMDGCLPIMPPPARRVNQAILINPRHGGLASMEIADGKIPSCRH